MSNAQDKIHMVSLANDTESQAFLNVVDESGGRAATKDIRAGTDLSESQIQYRFGKLEEMGLIEIERDASLTVNNEKMKVAVLTDKAREEIDKGLLVEKKQELEQQPDLDEIVEDIEELRVELEALRNRATDGGDPALAAEVEELSETVDRVREALNTRIVPGLRMLYDSVGRLELVLEDEGIEVTGTEVPPSKQKEMNRRLSDFEKSTGDK